MFYSTAWFFPSFSVVACQPTLAQLKCALKRRQQCDPQIAVNSLRSAYKLILKNHNGGTARGIEWALTFRLAAKISPQFFATVGSLNFRSTRNVKTSLHATKFWKAVGRFNWSSFFVFTRFRNGGNFFPAFFQGQFFQVDRLTFAVRILTVAGDATVGSFSWVFHGKFGASRTRFFFLYFV